MIYTDELRQLASAAFDLGYRTRFLAIPEPTWRDRLEAQYGPMGEGWRWEGPWRRFTSVDHYDRTKERTGWERFFSTPVRLDDGSWVWCLPGTDRPYDMGVISLWDEGVPSNWWSDEYQINA